MYDLFALFWANVIITFWYSDRPQQFAFAKIRSFSR
jgi:hypothetical protein